MGILFQLVKGKVMKDKKIHDLIEQGNKGTKEKSWHVLEESFSYNQVYEQKENGGSTLSVAINKKIVFAATIFIVLLGVALILIFNYANGKKAFDDLRFYSESEYSQIITDTTLKEYSDDNNLGLLYFDWYDETYYIEDMVYTLNESGDVVCYRETVFDNALGNLIVLFVVENNVNLDFLNIIENTCTFDYQTESGQHILWGGDELSVYAILGYNGFKYYLQVDDINGKPEDVLLYMENLMSKFKK